MYTKQIGDRRVILLIWVDDVIIAASDIVLMDKVKGMMKEDFE